MLLLRAALLSLCVIFALIALYGVVSTFRFSSWLAELRYRHRLTKIAHDNIRDVPLLERVFETKAQTRQVIHDMFKHYIEVLSLHNVDWWLDSGSLIGQVRSQAIIPWDNDGDICITTEGLEILQRIQNQTWPDRFGLFAVEGQNVTNDFGRVCDRLLAARFVDFHTGRYIDSFLVQPTADSPPNFFTADSRHALEACEFGKGVRIEFDDDGTKRFSLLYRNDLIFPLQDCPFDGLIARCPAQPREYLMQCFPPSLAPEIVPLERSFENELLAGQLLLLAVALISTATIARRFMKK